MLPLAPKKENCMVSIWIYVGIVEDAWCTRATTSFSYHSNATVVSIKFLFKINCLLILLDYVHSFLSARKAFRMELGRHLVKIPYLNWRAHQIPGYSESNYFLGQHSVKLFVSLWTLNSLWSSKSSSMCTKVPIHAFVMKQEGIGIKQEFRSWGG